MNNHKAMKEIRETYPKVVDITNSWLGFWISHSFVQSEEQKEILTRFSEAMKQITKEDEGKA